MKIKHLFFSIFFLSFILNIFLVREIIKYEPDGYKYRHYYALRQKGWFNTNKKESVVTNDSTLVVLTLGQSNAANSSSDNYQPRENVFTYSNGQIYEAEEPLIGNGGAGCSVWTRLADKLITEGICKKVILVPIAVGSTNIQNWASGDCNAKLISTLKSLKENNIKLTHILWHQGEADNGKSVVAYKNNLEKVLNTFRLNGVTAPFYCSIATYNPLESFKNKGVDFNLQNAQKSFISENENVYAGPNTDKLIHAIYRVDSQHFSSLGNRKYAELWFQSLKNVTSLNF